jgi:hypothetical protein
LKSLVEEAKEAYEAGYVEVAWQGFVHEQPCGICLTDIWSWTISLQLAETVVAANLVCSYCEGSLWYKCRVKCRVNEVLRSTFFLLPWLTLLPLILSLCSVLLPHIVLFGCLSIRSRDFYFCAPGSLVVLNFLQPLNFFSVFPSL